MTLVYLYTNLTPIRGKNHSSDFRLITSGLDVSTPALPVTHVYFDRNESDVSAPLDLNVIVQGVTNLAAFMNAYATGQNLMLSLLVHRKDGDNHTAMLEIDSDAAKVVSMFFEDDDSDDPGSINLTLRLSAGTIHTFEPDPTSSARTLEVSSYSFG